MRYLPCFDGAIASVLTLVGTSVQAALIVNPPDAITEVVRIQPIIVSDNNGGNTAEFFGTASQQANIEKLIDSIWAQASIDVDWLTPSDWSNTSANNGSLFLSQLSNLGASAGVTHPDPSILNLFFVEITSVSGDKGENSVNGFGWVGANGIVESVGDNLPGFLRGREIVARVTAHEIGHNLGLLHIVESQNLMQKMGAPNLGERLSPDQITKAIQSRFTEPLIADSADFDSDSDTDGIDFLTWQQYTNGTGPEADANHDQNIDGKDLIIWQREFGNTAASEITQLQTAPEPTTIVLVAFLLLAWVSKRQTWTTRYWSIMK